MREKRGVSNIVTTVLIILLVVIAIIILWMLLRPLIFEDTGDTSQLEVRLTLNKDLLCVKKPVVADGEWLIRLPVERASGAGDLLGFDILVEKKDGTIQIFQFLGNNDKLSEGSTKNYELNQTSEDQEKNKTDFSQIKKITLMPIVRTSKGTETMSNIREEYILTGYERECEAGEAAGPTPKPKSGGGGGGGVDTCTPAGFSCIAGNACPANRGSQSSYTCDSGKVCCGPELGITVESPLPQSYNKAEKIPVNIKTNRAASSCNYKLDSGASVAMASTNNLDFTATDLSGLSDGDHKIDFECKASDGATATVSVTFSVSEIVNIDCECMNLLANTKYKLTGCTDGKLILDKTRAFLEFGTSKACFLVSGNNVELDLNDNEIRFTSQDVTGYFGVAGQNVENVIVKNGRIRGFRPDAYYKGQVYFSNSKNIDIYKINVSSPDNGYGSGISFWVVSQSKIRESISDNNVQVGIVVTSGSRANVVTANNVPGNLRGIHVSGNCDYNNVSDNVVIGKASSTEPGIVLESSGNEKNLVANNTIVGHGAANAGAIRLSDQSKNNIVYRNDVIQPRGIGIEISKSNENNITRNNISLAVIYGVLILGGEDNYIFENNVTNTPSNQEKGIMLSGDVTGAITKNNRVNHNYVALCKKGGIELYKVSDTNYIINNTIVNSGGASLKHALNLFGSSNNIFNDNNITLTPSGAMGIYIGPPTGYVSPSSNFNKFTNTHLELNDGSFVQFQGTTGVSDIGIADSSDNTFENTKIFVQARKITGYRSIGLGSSSLRNKFTGSSDFIDFRSKETSPIKGPLIECGNSDNIFENIDFDFETDPAGQYYFDPSGICNIAP